MKIINNMKHIQTQRLFESIHNSNLMFIICINISFDSANIWGYVLAFKSTINYSHVIIENVCIANE